MNKDYFSEKNDLDIRFNLTMIIPTLNRPDVLYAQVKSLIRNFNRIKPKIKIQLYISENNSDVEKKINKNILNSIIEKNINESMEFIFIRRTERISLGNHMNLLSKSVNCDWITWIGDDDLLTPTYLSYIIRVIELDDVNVQSVFPGHYSNNYFSQDNFFELSNPIETIDDKRQVEKYNLDSKSIVKIINRGTQLSGLLYRKKIIDLANEVLPAHNLFPWVCYQIMALKEGTILALIGYHARITSDTAKLFSYRKDGLLTEISEAIICGFYPDNKLGSYYAGRVIKEIAFWRIFKTSKTGLGALKNYILSYYDHSKINGRVFFIALPKIISQSFYQHLVHSMPNLHRWIRHVKKIVTSMVYLNNL